MKVSSTSSSSSTSSLGNTSLQGFGGLVSGLDRDALIEQLTSATSSKITSQKQAITKEKWTQEAIQNITDKTIDLEDTYFTYSSSSSLKSPTLYAASVLTAEGNEDATKYVKASGSSDMLKYLTVQGVKQLATSATLVSGTKGSSQAITTASLRGNATLSNIIPGASKIKFGAYTSTSSTSGQSFQTYDTFTFPTSYTDSNGKTVTIDYTGDTSTIVNQLNEYLNQNSVKISASGELLHFGLTSDGNLQMQAVKKDTQGNITSTVTAGDSGYAIQASDDVLKALGVNTTTLSGKNAEYATKGATLGQINESVDKKLSESIVNTDTSRIDYLKSESLSFTYGGESHTVTIDSSAQSGISSVADYKSALQTSIDKSFGSGKITVEAGDDGSISFIPTDTTMAFSVTSSNPIVRDNMGIAENASTKINRTGSIYENREALGFNKDITEDELTAKLANFSINGTNIKGITSSTSVDSLLSAINNNTEAGVKATYLSGTNQFALIAANTGSGRTISLDDDTAAKIFGVGTNGSSTDGQDAILQYSYGGTISQTVTSSSNTFNIEGLSVTVSGVFGYEKDSSGNLTNTVDSSMAVTFSATADADKAAEKVKAFINAFNEIVTAVNDQVRTRPDSSYKPLTEDQEDEMTEKQIEEWNKKAKEGILYNNSTVRDYSDALQTINLSMLKNGFSNSDLESIGITFSDDTTDGGKITFDEDTFKSAMANDPDKVSQIMAGGNGKTGLVQTIENTMTPFATRYRSRNGNSYGRLVEEGGSSKLYLSTTSNQIYKSLQEMNTKLESLKTLLKTEQDRYITEFTSLETLINDMNAQSSYISGMGA